MAINAPIQGSQADLIKIAMARIDTYLEQKGLEKEVRMLLQVHDELIFEIKSTLIDGLLDEIQNIMQSVLTPEQTKGVPIVSNRAVGTTWGEMESA